MSSSADKRKGSPVNFASCCI